MKKYLFFLYILIFTLNAFEIKNYTPIKRCIKNSNLELEIAIREFEVNSTKYFLTINPTTLQTTIKEAKESFLCPKDIETSRYYQLLNASLNNTNHPLQNDGIKEAKEGVYLTTDLCPSSKKGFEERLYKEVINSFKNPVPITIFITSRWINKHKIEFNKLKNWQKEGKLDIVWGNHTAKHIYHPKEPLKSNFVLSKEENLPKDILDLEKTLIKEEVTPSIFFRFPGLVSNKESIEIVKNLGLITIGSNAWLAKGEKVKSGSIILLHGNKNEPRGVDIFLKLLKDGLIKELNSTKDIEVNLHTQSH